MRHVYFTIIGYFISFLKFEYGLIWQTATTTE